MKKEIAMRILEFFFHSEEFSREDINFFYHNNEYSHSLPFPLLIDICTQPLNLVRINTLSLPSVFLEDPRDLIGPRPDINLR